MWTPGLPELIVILVIVLIFFGAGKLPEIGKAIGKGIRGFRDASKEPEQEPPKIESGPPKEGDKKASDS